MGTHTHTHRGLTFYQIPKKRMNGSVVYASFHASPCLFHPIMPPFFCPSCHPRTSFCLLACAAVHVRVPPEELKCWCHSQKDRVESDSSFCYPWFVCFALGQSCRSAELLLLETAHVLGKKVCVCLRVLCLRLRIQAAIACVPLCAVWLCGLCDLSSQDCTLI